MEKGCWLLAFSFWRILLTEIHCSYRIAPVCWLLTGTANWYWYWYWLFMAVYRYWLLFIPLPHPMNRFFLILIMMAMPFWLFAQKPSRIKLEHADVIEFDNEINPNADRLLGNVGFSHENAFMYCDSAYLYKETNTLEAFGNVRIKRGDSLTMTGKHLIYLGDSRLAQVFENVVMRDRQMTLNTERLDYNMETEVAFYLDSAHIVDAGDVLTSKLGYYYSNSRDMFFRKDVVLTNPNFKLTCD